jgi:hypothetical protein
MQLLQDREVRRLIDALVENFVARRGRTLLAVPFAQRRLLE